MKKISEMDDGLLLEEMMDWFRISRNQGGLEGAERSYFQGLCKEIGQRGLLNKDKLFIDKSDLSGSRSV